MNALPSWLVDVLACPEDGGALQRGDSGLRCVSCGRVFALREGVLELLPDRLVHVGSGAAATPDADAAAGDIGSAAAAIPDADAAAGDVGSGAAATPDADAAAGDVGWVEDELAWWNPWFEQVSAAPLSPRSGLRGRSRELHLLRHVRDRLPPSPVVVEMGAGTSRTMAGLWPSSGNGLRYVATDISPAALRAGRTNLGPGAASVQCDAVAWPVREGAADVVLILGVLHHLSDWPAALNHACRTVRPGGFLLLHEAVTKPRVLGRFRSEGVDDHWVSPHEGDVPEGRLRAELEARGEVLHWRGELSPLRFGLERWLINKRGLDDRLERSRAMTMAFNGADQAFGRAFGRLAPSLGFNEVSVVWRRAR